MDLANYDGSVGFLERTLNVERETSRWPSEFSNPPKSGSVNSLIQAIDLTKRYENGLLALDALNLSVKSGEIYCLLGASGASKTTTINLFLNIIEPTSGRAFINGTDVAKYPSEAKKHVSYVSDDVTLYSTLTARQNLEFFVRLGGARNIRKEDCRRALREVGLQEKAFDEPVKKLSRGVRQKIAIAIATIRNTPAILLDEPTTGLDPKAIAEFMELLNELRESGKAILMSTTDIFCVKEIADRVGIMKDGRKVLERTRRELEHDDLQALYLDYMHGYATHVNTNPLQHRRRPINT